MTPTQRRRIIFTRLTDADAETLLTLSERHVDALKQYLAPTTSINTRIALKAEIEALRAERESLIAKYC